MSYCLCTGTWTNVKIPLPLGHQEFCIVLAVANIHLSVMWKSGVLLVPCLSRMGYLGPGSPAVVGTSSRTHDGDGAVVRSSPDDDEQKKKSLEGTFPFYSHGLSPVLDARHPDWAIYLMNNPSINLLLGIIIPFWHLLFLGSKVSYSHGSAHNIRCGHNLWEVGNRTLFGFKALLEAKGSSRSYAVRQHICIKHWWAFFFCRCYITSGLILTRRRSEKSRLLYSLKVVYYFKRWKCAVKIEKTYFSLSGIIRSCRDINFF